MIKYRISKYNPKNKNLQNTWSSYSDIGKIYNGKIFTVEEYLLMEKNYINLILFILKENNIKNIKLEKLEIVFSIQELNKMLNDSGLFLSLEDINLINNLKNNKIFTFYELPRLIRLILRECFWGVLVSKNSKCIIEFGYDYYMYISGINLKIPKIVYLKNLNLYIEKLVF